MCRIVSYLGCRVSNHVDVKISHVIFIFFPKSRVLKDKLDFVNMSVAR